MLYSPLIGLVIGATIAIFCMLIKCSSGNNKGWPTLHNFFATAKIKVKPSQAKPSQAKPSQTKPTQTKQYHPALVRRPLNPYQSQIHQAIYYLPLCRSFSLGVPANNSSKVYFSTTGFKTILQSTIDKPIILLKVGVVRILILYYCEM
ncbi:MAG: hypothetical protein H0U57_07770 [Tatlockia sp.]|nr:hypothetical protein [Tatlockia sp.]